MKRNLKNFCSHIAATIERECWRHNPTANNFDNIVNFYIGIITQLLECIVLEWTIAEPTYSNEYINTTLKNVVMLLKAASKEGKRHQEVPEVD